MKYLLKKSFKDIKLYKMQFFSLFMMTFLSVLIYVGIEGLWHGMEVRSKEWFKESNIADAWIYGTEMNDQDTSELLKINNVNEVQGVTILNTTLNSKRKQQIQLISSDKNTLSQPILTLGKKYSSNKSGVWLYEEFAELNKIEVGSIISLKNNDVFVELKVNGLIMSPEYLYYSGSTTSSLPDRKQYGYGIVSQESMKELLNISISQPLSFNQIRITYDRKTSKNYIREKVEDKLDDKFASFYTHEDYIGVSNFIEASKSFRNNSILFSALFIILSILTISATIKRIIEKQRGVIGTMKAIGYGNLSLQTHYAMFGFITSLLGGLLGYIIAPLTVSKILIHVEKDFYSVHKWVPENSIYSLIIIGVIVLICSMTALIVSIKGTQGLPVESMREPVMSVSKPILLEQFPFIWNSMSYEWKRIWRESFRRKGATLMGILAVGGSLTLLITGFGTSDSLSKTNDIVYGKQFNYGSRLVFTPLSKKIDRDELITTFKNDVQRTQETPMEIKTAKENINTLGYIYEPHLFVHLSNINSKKIELPKDGITISKGFASKNNLSVNDNIQLRVPGYNEFKTTRITDIIETFAPQGIFISMSSWQKLGYEFNPNVLLLKNDKVSSEIINDSIVQEISPLSVQLSSANKVIDSMNVVVLILLLASIVLALVILINLGLLSYSEKYREYATQKVLGYSNKEIKTLIIGDTLIQLIIGIAIGIPCGYIFLNTFVGSFATTNFQYITYIHPVNLFISFSIVIGATWITNTIISYEIKNIDMVSALKAID